MVLPNSASIKGVGMNAAATTIGGKELREGSMEIVRDDGGNNVFLAIWDDKKVASTGGVEVVLPSRTWVDSWLRTVGTGSAPFSISVHGLYF